MEFGISRRYEKVTQKRKSDPFFINQFDDMFASAQCASGRKIWGTRFRTAFFHICRLDEVLSNQHECFCGSPIWGLFSKSFCFFLSSFLWSVSSSALATTTAYVSYE